MRLAAAFAPALACALWPAPARAQCAEGRALASGRCCWPGQTFDAAARACVGAPRCPDPLVAHGEACVPSLAPRAHVGGVVARPSPAPRASNAPPFASVLLAAVASAPPPQIDASGWPAAPAGLLAAAARNPRWARTGRDDGLIAAGVAIFAVSYLFAAIPVPAIWAGVHRTFFGEQPDVPYWPAAFVPLLPLVTQVESTSSPYLFALPSTIGQCVGVGLVLAGVFARREEVRLGSGAALRVRAGARGAVAGGGVELVF